MIDLNKVWQTKQIFVFSLCMTISLAGKAQVNADSLRQLWQNKSLSDSIRFKAINTYYKSHTYAQPDTVLSLTDYHIGLAKENDSNYEISKALNEKSYAFYLKGYTKKSMSALEESIAIVEKLARPKYLATLYSNVGNIYGEEKKYKEALENFYKTLKIYREQNDRKGEARLLRNIGKVYALVDSHELALDHLERSREISNELGQHKVSSNVLAQIASVNYKKGKYAEAIKLGVDAVQTLLETNNKFSAADCYLTIAKAHKQLGHYEEARQYIDKCLVIDQQIKNKSKIIERRTFDAELFLDSDVSKATQKAEAVLELIEDDTKYELKTELYKLLYKCYKAQNKYDLSLSMHEKQILYNDSLQLQINKTAVMRKAIQNEYEAKLTETQLASQESQNKLKGDHLKKTALIAAAFSLIILLLSFYSRSVIKSNHKERQLLLDEIEKLKNLDASLLKESSGFDLDRGRIEGFISRKINETDWKVLNILLDDPVIPNKEIAKKAFMSADGIGSSLRRMYDYFEVKDSKYKKISLLMMAIKVSNK